MPWCQKTGSSGARRCPRKRGPVPPSPKGRQPRGLWTPEAKSCGQLAHRAPSTAGQVVRVQRGHETQTHSPVGGTTGQPGDRCLRSQKGLVMRRPCRERVRNRAPSAWLQTGLPRGVCQSPRFPDPSQACQDRVILRWHGSSPQAPTWGDNREEICLSPLVEGGVSLSRNIELLGNLQAVGAIFWAEGS